MNHKNKVALIKERLKAARDRQKSYADNRRKTLEFEVGPFEILERIGHVAYHLILPQELSNIHDTFHVSNMNKCLADANLHVPLKEIRVDKTLRFVEELEEIIDREVKKLKRSRISIVKVRWNSKRGPEFTWEREDFMKAKEVRLPHALWLLGSERYAYLMLFGYLERRGTPTSCFVVTWIGEVRLPHVVWLLGAESRSEPSGTKEGNVRG
ncbi:hypothetical protein Tco_0000151 [Tanacetum coccineum]